jgi:membrane-associated phospholipid phosphatase
METTLQRPRDMSAPRESDRKPPLAWLRRQFLAVDVVIVGFLLFLIGWTLLSLVVPQARLYAYEPRYQWAELPAWSLIGQLVLILCAYMVFQRFGVYYHRVFTSTGDRAPRWLHVANLVYVFIPILLIPLVFNLLGAFIAGVSGVPGIETHGSYDPAAHYDPAASYWDLWLKEADVSMFGVYPAAWLRKFHTPWSVGLMMLCYLAYYVSPLVAVLPQILKRDWPVVRRCAAMFAGALIMTYFGYILLPATGPRFEGTFAAWQSDGWFATSWWQGILDSAEVIRWDAFPSGHVAIAIVACVLALKYHRRVGLAYVPFVAGLFLATVFLGYHYVTDVVAGALFAAAAFILLQPAVAWWESVWTRPDSADKA